MAVDRTLLKQALQDAQSISARATSGEGFDPRGGLGVLALQLGTAGIGAFEQNRARKKLLEEDEADRAAFATNFPKLAGLNLSRETRDAARQSRVQSQFTDPAGPVSPQGKLLQDVKGGFVPKEVASRKLRSEDPIFPGAEINQIDNLSDRADALEDIADQNIAQGNTKIGGQQARKSRTLRKEFRDDQKLIEKDAQKLSASLDKSGIVDLVDSLETITSIINSNPEDLPGVGATAIIPGLTLSREGKQLRQSIGTLRNSILKARSGGAVTPSESERLLEELGSGIGRTDKQLKIGIQNVIKTFKNKLGNIRGGFRQEASELLIERSGSDIFERINTLGIADPQADKEGALAELKRRGLI